MSSDFSGPLLLHPRAQQYHWGKVGKESLVARLLSRYAADQPYAELWIGAHPSAPSDVEIQGRLVPLNDLLRKHPVEILGQDCLDRFGPSLPLLLKVLSIASPLSIQTHPNHEQAQRLCRRDPQRYPDSQPKTELALALTEVRLLCGFRPWNEIEELLRGAPDLQCFVSEPLVQQTGEVAVTGADPRIKSICAALFAASATKLSAITEATANIFRKIPRRSAQQELFVELAAKFGFADRGVLASLFLNHLILQPREAVAIEPGTLHAYLSGDLVECMTNSDNVLRAGLTPKFVDVETLLEIGSFRSQAPQVIRAADSESAISVRALFDGSRAFELLVISGTGSQYLPQLRSCALLFSLDGKGRLSGDHGVAFSPGLALLLPAAGKFARLELDQGTIFLAKPYC